jgi:hypothetical protein
VEKEGVIQDSKLTNQGQSAPASTSKLLNEEKEEEEAEVLHRKPNPSEEEEEIDVFGGKENDAGTYS